MICKQLRFGNRTCVHKAICTLIFRTVIQRLSIEAEKVC